MSINGTKNKMTSRSAIKLARKMLEKECIILKPIGSATATMTKMLPIKPIIKSNPDPTEMIILV